MNLRLRAPRKIAHRIILLVLGLEFLSIAAWGGLTYHAARTEVLAAISARLNEAALRTQANSAGFLSPIVAHAEALAATLAIVRPDSTQGRVLANRFLKGRPEVDALSVTDAAGREQLRLARMQGYGPADLRDLAADPLVTQARAGRSASSAIGYSDYNEPILRLATPLGSHGGSGALVSEINLKWLWDMVDLQHIGATGYIYILDRDFRVVAHNDPSLVLAGVNARAAGLPAALFTETNGNRKLRVYRSLLDQRVAGTAQYDPALDWWIIVEQPVEEGLAPLNRIIWRFATALGLAFVLTVTLVLYFSRRTMRPLEELEQAAERLAGGDRDVRVAVPATSELASLAHAFNHMATCLAQTIEQLDRQKELAQVTLASIGDAVITTDAVGAITFLNPVAEAITGWHGADATGRMLKDVYRIVGEADGVEREPPVARVLEGTHVIGFSNHTLLLDRHGRTHAIEDTAAPIRDRAGSIVGVVLVFHDVSEKRELLRRLEHHASHDDLTGLINRREFENRLDDAIASAQAGVGIHALCYLDLDQFKLLNDTCGHTAGDELLGRLPGLWEKLLGEGDTLARVGGDEFAVLLRDRGLEQAVAVAEQLRQALDAFRFVWNERVFTLDVSIGLAMLDRQCGDRVAMLAAADTACYAAKAAGRNRVSVYRADDAEVAARLTERDWVQRLREAIRAERFCLHFQEIRPIRGGESHLEILLRLRSEDSGMEAPGVFLPIAERQGLMPQIDRWVIGETLRWMARQEAPPLCAINLSGHSLADETLPAHILDAIAASGISPQRICLEITETAAIDNLARATRFIATLKRAGCLFALDDFGSGASSFRYLKNLPVDFLKIDGAFVRAMDRDPIDRAMVESMHRIGRVMEIPTIAEFVENQAILDALGKIGVDFAQGYHIARPRPLAEWRPTAMHPG